MIRQKHKNLIRKLAVKLVEMLAVIAIFNGQTTFSQVVRRKPPTAIVQKKQIFKGKSIVRADLQITKLPEFSSPAAISLSDISRNLAQAMYENGFAVKLDGSMPLEKFADLNIQVPMINQKASLEFYKPTAVSPRVNAAMLGENVSSLRINFKPSAPGKWYVISCLVSSAGLFTVAGPDGNKTEISAENNGLIHTFVLSQNTAWQSILIWKPSTDGNDFWYVRACSINTPNLP